MADLPPQTLTLMGLGLLGLLAILIAWRSLAGKNQRLERKAVEALHQAAVLKRSQSQTQTDVLDALNQAPYLILLFHPDTREVTFANSVAKTYLGTGNAQNGLTTWQVASESGSFDSAFDALVGDYIQQNPLSGFSVSSAMRHLRLNGESRWFSVTFGYIKALPGSPVYCLLEDCSRQMEAERRLGFYRKTLERIANHEPMDRILQDLFEHAETLYRGARCALYLSDEDRYLERDGRVAAPLFTQDSQSITQIAMSTRQLVICEHIEADPRITRAEKGRLQREGFECWLSDPMLDASGKVLGSFELLLPAQTAARPIATEHLSELKGLAQVVLENRRSITLLQQTEADESFTQELVKELKTAPPEHLMETFSSALERVYSHLSLSPSQLELWLLDFDSNRYLPVSTSGQQTQHRSIPANRPGRWQEHALQARLTGSAPLGVRENCYRITRDQAHFSQLMDNLSRRDALNVDSLIVFPLQSRHRLEGFISLVEGSRAHAHTLHVIDTLAPLFRDLLARNHLMEGQTVNPLRDPLTGLFNQQKMFDALTHEVNRAQRYKTQFGLLMAEIDDLSGINDRLGHDTGDQVIRLVTQLFKGAVRSADVVGRITGNRYMLLLPETGLSGAVNVAKSLHAKVADLETPALPAITISVGVTCAGTGDTPQNIWDRAEQLILEARRRGRSSTVVEEHDHATMD